MSIALETGFVLGVGCFPIYESAEIEERERMDPSASPASSSSSSFGKDSDAVGSQEEREDGGDEEVQSKYKRPLQGMESLEESLPIRRSISNFYAGKSKSFTSLSDAAESCDCAKDLGKEENAYSRRRRNLLALKTMLEKPHSSMLRSSGGGITKKPTAPTTRSTLAVAVAMSGSTRHSNGGEDDHDQQNLIPPVPRPAKNANAVASSVSFPSPKQCSFPMRSFSLGDLLGMASLGSSIEQREIQKMYEK